MFLLGMAFYFSKSHFTNTAEGVARSLCPAHWYLPDSVRTKGCWDLNHQLSSSPRSWMYLEDKVTCLQTHSFVPHAACGDATVRKPTLNICVFATTNSGGSIHAASPPPPSTFIWKQCDFCICCSVCCFLYYDNAVWSLEMFAEKFQCYAPISLPRLGPSYRFLLPPSGGGL